MSISPIVIKNLSIPPKNIKKCLLQHCTSLIRKRFMLFSRTKREQFLNHTQNSKMAQNKFK